MTHEEIEQLAIRLRMDTQLAAEQLRGHEAECRDEIEKARAVLDQLLHGAGHGNR